MISLILATIGTVSSLAGIYYFVADINSRRRFGWKHVERLITRMISDIDRSKFTPDMVIGIGRGGAIVAGILAGNLGHIPLFVIDTKMVPRNGIRTAELQHPECVPDIEGKSVLLVVGELYSGQDLRRGIEFVEERRVGDLRTASLLTHPAASVHPDFYGLETDKPLSAPWRISNHYKDTKSRI